MIVLHHSSIANIYFKAYQSFPDLSGRLRDYDEFGLFRRYLESKPTNLLDVITGLGWDLLDAKKGRTILRRLVESGFFVDLVKEAIDKEEDLEKVGDCLFCLSIVGAGKVARRIVENIDVQLLVLKIDKEEDLWKIGYCLVGITGVSEEVARRIAEGVDVQLLVSKINKEEDLQKITFDWFSKRRGCRKYC
ncbi:MAG: hypothetical protein ACXQTS_07140 [Candidatus Methanospirareceae archaeon]